MISDNMDTPLGRLTIFADREGITRIDFPIVRVSAPPQAFKNIPSDSQDRVLGDSNSFEFKADVASTSSDNARRILEWAKLELRQYFQGKLQSFTVPFCLCGTPFQVKVWRTLLDIPFGESRTYGQIAALIGQPKACRAVGMACHANKIPLIVPCHRVLGKGRFLGGFAPGLDFKRFLLALEKTDVPRGTLQGFQR